MAKEYRFSSCALLRWTKILHLGTAHGVPRSDSQVEQIAGEGQAVEYQHRPDSGDDDRIGNIFILIYKGKPFKTVTPRHCFQV